MLNPSFISNYNGDTTITRQGVKRWSRTSVELDRVLIDVHYEPDGYYVPATEVDAVEYPNCLVRKLEINGADVTLLLESKSDEIAEIIEQRWKRGEA